MKKDEYLNKISQGLKQYDQTYVQEILDDMKNTFRTHSPRDRARRKSARP